MEKKRYIPVKGRKIYVEKELFDEYNRIRSRQCYHNNKYAAATCELKESDQDRHCESVEETVTVSYTHLDVYKRQLYA